MLLSYQKLFVTPENCSMLIFTVVRELSLVHGRRKRKRLLSVGHFTLKLLSVNVILLEKRFGYI